MKIFRTPRPAALLALLALASPGEAQTVMTTPAKAEVYVVGTLYRRHETVAAFDLGAVRRLVLAIKPDVLVVDCTPKEVRERSVHASKIEYTQVIFPLIQREGYKVYPAEPDEPLFTEIVQAVSTAHETFRKTQPESAAVLQDYVKATYAALSLRWRSPADVQDALTGQLLAAKTALEGELVGTAAYTARWNRHWADAILRAAVENPGKRVLALTGIENREWIVDSLRQSPTVALVDLPNWLRANLP